jgi:hypothetical protein
MQISCIPAEISGFSGKSRASGFCGSIFQQKPSEETCIKMSCIQHTIIVGYYGYFIVYLHRCRDNQQKTYLSI